MTLTRRTFLQWSGSIAASTLAVKVLEQGRALLSRPNILVIMADSPWGCYSNQVIRTPNLDCLASRGIPMANSLVYTSICSPSRMTFLLGRVPQQHIIHDFLTANPIAKPTQGRKESPPSFKDEAIILTVAGNGAPGYAGDGGPATHAQLNWPRDMAIGADGSLYIADTMNHRIRKVNSDGTIGTVVGTGTPGYSGDGGQATAAQLNGPRDVEVGADGSLYIADTDNHCIRKVSPDGVITTLAGTGTSGYNGDNKPASEAQLAWPQDIAVGMDGSLYIADTGNHRIRKVSPHGTIDTVAGTGLWGYSGDDGPAIRAQLARPRGVSVDTDGCLYIGDTENHRIRKVTPDGIIITVAGNGTEGYSGDGGPATRAQLAWPRGVAVDAEGCLFIADCGNSVIRKVAPDGTITTLAGTGTEGYSGDGGPATRGQLADPHGIVVGADGSLYIGEPRNHCIRKVLGVAAAKGDEGQKGNKERSGWR